MLTLNVFMSNKRLVISVQVSQLDVTVHNMLSSGREAQPSAKLKGQSRHPIIFYGRRDNVD